MAGIGFELRRILDRDSYAATLQAYIYAGLISAGPWVLSILSVLIVGILSLSVVVPETNVVQFLVSITYLMAVSLTVTGGLQLIFTRFVSDRLFDGQDEMLTPNLFGLLLLVTIGSVTSGGAFCWLYFPVVIFLSGMKAYNRILLIMFLGYATMVVASAFLRHFNKEGLLLGFLLGHTLLLYCFVIEIIRQFPIKRWFAFDFLNRELIYISLFFTGLLYYAAIWVDKFIFWLNPLTSEAIVGPLRASGDAVFLVGRRHSEHAWDLA